MPLSEDAPFFKLFWAQPCADRSQWAVYEDTKFFEIEKNFGHFPKTFGFFTKIFNFLEKFLKIT